MPTLRGCGERVTVLGTTAWYLAGGCPAPIAVWQPKVGNGWTPATIAQSYVNRVNPGTYNAAPGTAPAWAGATGWTFTAASLQYLTTGLIPTNNQTWSMLVRYSSATAAVGAAWAGAYNTTGFILQQAAGPVYRYWNGNFSNGTAAVATGAATIALAGTAGYLNGLSDTTGIAAVAGTHGQIYLGAWNNATTGGTPNGYSTTVITAVAVWNVNISAYVAALHAALVAASL